MRPFQNNLTMLLQYPDVSLSSLKIRLKTAGYIKTEIAQDLK